MIAYLLLLVLLLVVVDLEAPRELKAGDTVELLDELDDVPEPPGGVP